MARILILGGTTEARALAETLGATPGHDVTVSLAGRTEAIVPQGAPTRIGGFGGADGLARRLAADRIDILVDATHPFAETISANAVAAARAAGVPLLALRRPEWAPVAGDRWTVVASMDAASAALGDRPRRVFLAIGRQELAAFAGAPQHFYLVRSVDPVDAPANFSDAAFVVARGPFTAAEDEALLRAHRIDLVVSRNSGGDAAYGKIAAARALGLPVIMVARPVLADAETVGSVADALETIAHLASRAERGA